MSSDFVTIIGATGHIGRGAAEILIKKGMKVRAVARTASKLSDLKGAEAFSADITDTGSLAHAFTGAKAVFAMLPPTPTSPDIRADQNRMADSIDAAVTAAKVTHLVVLSSIGANQGTQMGPVNGIHDWEEKLKKLSGVNVLILRPAYFMENLLINVGLIKGNGIMGSPIKPGLSYPMIATRDIAAAVAEALEKRNFTGLTVRELLGQRDLTMEDARAAIARAISKPDLKYVQFPYAEAEKAMVGMGLSDNYARLLVEMMTSMNEGVMKATQARDAKTTTPTSIEWFAENVFAPAFGSPTPTTH